MADAECKLVEVLADCDRTEEPVPKKQRSSVLQNCFPDHIHSEQITSGDETGGSCAVEVSAQAGDTETESAVNKASAGAQGYSNTEPVTNELTKHYSNTGFMDDDSVHPNGRCSPELGDEDCSSHASSSDWTPQPRIGSYRFIQQQIMRETDPRTILNELLPDTTIPPDLDDLTLWKIVINITEPPKRKKRKDINTIDDVIRLLNDCKKILILTGAGVSVSCGIPDFRSRDGIYARLAVDFPDLPDPQAMFDIEYFRRDPRPFFKFAKEIFPGQFQPSLCHSFISMLDKKGKILRNYTQNIDALEQVAGVQRVMQCHGSFATASCLVCKHKVDCDAIREDVFKQVVPFCTRCSNNPFAIMKPDIVFFGENLPEAFHRAMKQDKDEVDLLIVIGSSLKVRPVALIPSSIPHEVPQILINREPLLHLNFDVELLGDCDVIINELCHRLGGDFEQLCYNSTQLSEITETPPPPPLPAIPEQACAEVQTSEVQKTEQVFIEQAETSEKVAVMDSCLNAPLSNNGGLSTSCTDKETRTSPDHRASTTKPSAQEKDGCPCAQPNLCHERSDVCENAQERVGIMDRLDMQTEEKHTHQSSDVPKQCWLKQICRNPISTRLGNSQYLFQVPNRYVFHGAEVYSCSEEETSSSSESESSCCSGSALDEQESDAEEDCTSGNCPITGEGSVGETVDKNKCISGIHTDSITESLETMTDL